jgi:D-3-phosphoglycerate dehydrogenase
VTASLVLALDTPVDDLSVEQSAADALGWSLRRWNGTNAELGEAAAVVHVRTRIDAEFIERLTSCGAIGRFGTGLDSVDLDAAEMAGIPVVNVRDYCVAELATHSVGLGLTLLLGIGPAHDNAAAQSLTWTECTTGHRRPGTTALVVGYGAVGRQIADGTAALGMRTLVNTRRPETQAALGHALVDLAAGLREADLVFLQRELSDRTRGFFADELLSYLRPGTIVVNTARKDLMDQAAVVSALRDGRLGGLGLDALLGPADPLTSILGDPRVVVTPHIGWYSERSLDELRRRTITDTLTAYQPLYRKPLRAGENT